jgi:CBS domain-containing protein
LRPPSQPGPSSRRAFRRGDGIARAVFFRAEFAFTVPPPRRCAQSAANGAPSRDDGSCAATEETTMKVSEVMSGDVYVVQQQDSIRAAAQLMRSKDIGSVPVSVDDKLVGMVTDRDIVVRALADGLDADTPVSQIMSEGIKYCFDDEDLRDVARNMSELCVRRLPVVDRDKRLVGFVSLSNIADAGDTEATETLLEGTATPH